LDYLSKILNIDLCESNARFSILLFLTQREIPYFITAPFVFYFLDNIIYEDFKDKDKILLV